jgi:hypothetical protein
MTMSMTAIDNEVGMPASRTRADWHLARVLSRENIVEELGAIPSQDRLTCRLHSAWVHQCVALPGHAFPNAGDRWCLRCKGTASVTVDESRGKAAVLCSGCGKPPNGLLGRQMARACLESVIESRRHIEEDSVRVAPHHPCHA